MIPLTPPPDASNLAQLQSDYVSGAPGKSYADGVLAKYKPAGAPGGNITPFSGGITAATAVPMGVAGSRYPFYSPFSDNEELYAGAQSWTSKAGNGLLKGAGLSLTTFANGTLGLLAGTMAAITDGKFSSFYDNEFSRGLDSWNQYMEQQFPNYYTHAENDAAWYSPTNLFTANFLFDKVIKNLGYSVGAIGAGMTYTGALRAIGLFSKVASAGGLARTAAVTEEMLSTVPQVQRASAVTGGIRQVSKDFLSNFNTLNTTQRIIASGLSTVGEASFEALQQLNDFRGNLIADYVIRNGKDPVGDDLTQINNISENAANVLFGLNTVLLAGTNFVQLPKIVGSSYRAEKNLFNQAISEIGEVAFDKELGKYASTVARSRAGKAWQTATHLAGLFFSPSEAFEETSQTAFNFGVTNYFEKARAGQQNDILTDIFGEGYRQALTTKEGLESLLIGGFSGGLAELRHNIKTQGLTGTGGTVGANTQAAVTAFNQRVFSGFLKDTTDSLNRGALLQQERTAAIRRGDFLEAKEKETDFTLNYLAPRIKYGRYDLVADDIARYRQLAATAEGLQQLKDQGIVSQETTGEQLMARLDNLDRHARHVFDQYQALNIRYSGIRDKDGKELYPAQVIDKMVYASAKIADYDSRISLISASLVDHAIPVQPVMDDMIKDDHPTEQTVGNAVTLIGHLGVSADVKDQLRTDLRDLVELGLRRKHFLKEYDQLKDHPQDYLDKKYGLPTAGNEGNPTIPQTSPDGRTTDMPLEEDKTYSLDVPYQREGNHFYPLPTLHFHDRNLLGELRMRTPDGQIKTGFPEEFGHYNISSPIDPMEAAVLQKGFETALDSVLASDPYRDLIDSKATFDQKIAAVNAADDPRLADLIQTAFDQQIALVEKLREKIRNFSKQGGIGAQLQAFFDHVAAAAGTIATGTPDQDHLIIEQLQEHEGAKKPITRLFRSSTSENTDIKGTGENNDFHRRANKFLNDLDKMEDRENIRVAVVTITNQAAMGLGGLIPATVPGTTISSTDPAEGIIRLVFIRSLPDGDYYIDVEGKKLSKVTQKPDYNALVYTTMPSASLTWRNGELRYIDKGPNAATEQTAKTYQEAWKIKRAELLAAAGSYAVYPFTVSRGFPTYDAAGTQSSVVGNLVSDKMLNTPLLVIPTHSDSSHQGRALGSIIHGEETVQMPLGRPVLQTTSHLLPLNNRKLSAREKTVVAQLIAQMAAIADRTGSIDKSIHDYLRGLLFWKAPDPGKPVSPNQIWFSNNYLYLGATNNRVPFIAELIENSAELPRFLDTVYISANNFLLTKNTGVPFNEIVGIGDDGALQQVQWKSYQHFLLDNKYTTTPDDQSGWEGLPREADQIPFTTDIVFNGPTNDPYAAPFQQKYIILSDFNLFPHSTKTNQPTTSPVAGPGTAAVGSPAASATQEPAAPDDFEPIVEAGGFILDGQHLNTISYKGKDIAKVAATFGSAGVTFGEYVHLGQKALTPEIKKAVLDLARIEISKALVAEAKRREEAKTQTGPGDATVAPQPAAGAVTQQPPPSVTAQTSNAPTAEDIFKNLRPNRNADDITGGAYRLLTTIGTIAREDLQALAAYHQQVLPQVPLHITEELIGTTDGGYAWGVLRDNAIYLYKHAEVGTGYHEIFESVYGMFLSRAEQRQIISEFKSRTGAFLDRETGQTVEYSSASDHQSKEQIAEEFRSYRLKGTPPPGARQKTFFKRLLDFIRRLLTGRFKNISALFKRIDQGYYSRRPVPFSNRASGDAYSRFIAGLNTKFIHETMQGMTALVFEELFSDNTNIIAFDEAKISWDALYKKVFDRMEHHFTKALPEALLADIQDAGLSEAEATKAKQLYADFLANSWWPIKNNWEALTYINSDFLRPFHITFDKDVNEDELEDNINHANRNNREYERDILRISARKNASTAVKLLFATLTQVENTTHAQVNEATLKAPARKYSALKLPLLVNYASTFNRLLYEVAGTNGLGNILSKIKTLAAKDSTYVRLYNRLKAGAGFDNLSVEDWKLLLKLYTVTSKQKPAFLLQVSDETGRTYIASANDNLQAKLVISGWLNGLKAMAGPGKLVQIEKNNYKVVADVLRNHDSASLNGKLAFLKELGIDFSDEQYQGLSSRDKRKFNDGAQRLFNQLSKTGDIATLSGRALGVSGALTKLAEAFVAATGETTESQHFNIDGEPVQNLILNNYVSLVLNDINHYPTRDQLLEALPHLGETFSQNSLLLEKGGILFDEEGNRRPDPLHLSVMEGTTVVGSRRGTSTAKLGIAGRRMLEFNQNLSGIYNILVPADAKTEWVLDLQRYQYIPFSDFANPGALSNKIYRIFKNYLLSEMQLAGEFDQRSYIGAISKQGKGLRFFKNILTGNLLLSAQQAIDQRINPNEWIKSNEAPLRQAIKDWISGLVDAQQDFFTLYRQIIPDSNETFRFVGLNGDFADDHKLPARLTLKELRQVIEFRTLNYVIQNIELHKLFFGDPALYPDATKRIKSFMSGRETSYHSDPDFDRMANIALNTAGTIADKIALQPTDPGYHQFRDYMPSVTATDIEVVGSLAMREDIPLHIRQAYDKVNEADAQSWMRLSTYREMLYKAGGRWTRQMEEQYLYEHAYERIAREKKGSYVYSNPALKEADQKIVAAGNPQAASFYVIKPIGSGIKHGAAFMDMFLDKTSTMPMFYRLIEGTPMEAVYTQMQQQDVSYLIVKSGRKIGSEQLHSLYNPDGQINATSFNNRINVPFKYFGIQVETGTHGHGQARGTQLTKLATLDLMEFGMPIDLDRSAVSLEDWNALSEREKESRSPIYRLVAKNRAILQSLATAGYRRILNRLGITETASGFQITDKTRIADFLKNEVTRRELPQNLRDAITIDPATGDFALPLEALPNYKALKNIIYSVVDRYMLSPLMPGGPKVQVSSAMFERNKRQAVYRPEGNPQLPWKEVESFEQLSDAERATVRLTSTDLKFYTPDAPYMEVYMPHWFKERLKERGLNLSDEALLQYLNKNDSALLTGIGFRIPTQSHNSIDRFRIKGFLPAEMGDTIIVPTEITVKAGSDFDIDKLNTYLKHFYLNAKGYPQIIEMMIADTSDDDQLALVYEALGLRRQSKSAAQIATEKSSNALINAIFGEEEPYDSHFETLESFIKKNKGRSIYEIYGEYDPQALENAYIQNLEDLLSLPQNFEKLITPNSADMLMELRSELNTALGRQSLETKENFGLLLDPMYVSGVRHNFLAGKDGVGIAALQQTGTALNQLTNILLNPENFLSKLNDQEKAVVQNLRILLPHNEINLNGQMAISLSGIRDKAGLDISAKISQYINGYVDVAKDPFIIELGAGLNVASTFMLLERLGVSTRDVVFFMNQPIVRDYLREMEIKGISTPVSDATAKIISQVKGWYPATRARTEDIDTGSLKANIIKHTRGEKFTAAENAAQQQILDEFLKYTVLADHLFQLQQAYNYDTANFSESSLIFRKQQFTERARTSNLLSSVDKILDNSFIGRVASNLARIKTAMGEIFALEKGPVASLLEDQLSYYVGRHVSEDDYLAVAGRLQASFLDYLTQVQGASPLNNRIDRLLLSPANVAGQLVNFKAGLSQDSDLAGNLMLKNLQPLLDDHSTAEPKNIMMVEKAYDAYTYNLLTEAMRELRDNVHSASLYQQLLALSILQSGVRRSPISFTDIIPVEDYAPYLAEATRQLSGNEQLKYYNQNFAFQRVHWWDERVVPTIEPKEILIDDEPFIPLFNVPSRVYRNLGITRQEYGFIQLNTYFQSRELNYPVVKVRHVGIDPSTGATYTREKQAEMRKNGDYSFIAYQLYQKVLAPAPGDELSPLSYPAGDARRPTAQNVIYKQINAWGKPGLVQEYYPNIRPSVLPSNLKVTEITDARIVQALTGAQETFLQTQDEGEAAMVPSKASAETLSLVSNFLEKIGVEVQQVKQIAVGGRKIAANGLADITRRLILVAEGQADTVLPEEAMHFAVEIIQQTNPTLFKQLLSGINSYDLYRQVLASYGAHPLYQKDGRPDIIKLKKEAIARVLVETIIEKNEGTTEKPELLARANSWWERILEFLKGLFNKAGFNPFRKAAAVITESNLQAPVTNQEEQFLQRNPSPAQDKLVDNLLNLHRQLSKEVDSLKPTESFYTIAGRRIAHRVTNLAKNYYDRKFRNKQITNTELQQALNDQKREKGQDGHSDLEDIFHRMVDDNGYLRDQELAQSQPSRLDPVDNTFYKTLESNLRQRLHAFKAGTRFFSEIMIYDQQKDEAGTIDFLAIEPDKTDGTLGKIHILDWKFITLQTDATDVPWYKKEAWNIQLSEYARILQTPDYGAGKKSFGMTRAIPIRARYSYEQDKKLKLYSIEIGGVDVKTITDNTILPVPTKTESTGNRQLDDLIAALNNLTLKIFETRSEPGREYQKNERLNDLVSAIRQLHVKRETEELFSFAKRDISNLNDFFKKYFALVEAGDQTALDALDINDLSRKILDAEDTVSLYQDFAKIFRKVFDPVNDKPLLQETEKISDNAEIVRGRLLELAAALRTNPIARGAGITDILNPEKAVSWYQKWVRSLSQGATKATKILWNIVNAINGNVAQEFSDQFATLSTLEKEVGEWVKAGGRTYRQVEDLIFAKDTKGRWNGKVISQVDPAFYNALSAAKIKHDATWINENIDLEAYKAWYKEQLQLRKDAYVSSRLHVDPVRDQELKNKRLQDFELQFDIVAYPDSAIGPANLKLNAYPNLEVWKSKAYAALESPENVPLLKLYQYWEKQLEDSYQLGMIKAWEKKTFFPNVRKDYLEKMIFGSGDKYRSANLAFLDALRAEGTDQVLGYTDINGNPQDRLSARYVYDLGQKVTDEDGNEFSDYSNKSTDLFKVMALWAKEMAKFRHKSEVEDTVRLLYLTEKNRKAIARSKTTGGIMVNGEGDPVLVDNIENSRYFKAFMDYYFYGRRIAEGQDVTFTLHYNKLSEKVNRFFGAELLPKNSDDQIVVSGKKMIGAVNRFFQMKTLGLNLATAVTNYVGGKANAYMLAGRYFTKTDYTAAALRVASAKFHTEEGTRYAGLLDYFLPLTEDTSKGQIDQLSVSKAIRVLSSDHLFYLMRTSDKLVQYPAAIAFFDNTMVEDGKLVNIRQFVKDKNGYAGIYRLSAAEQKALRQKIEQEISSLKDTRSLPKIMTIVNDQPDIPGITRKSQTVFDLRNSIQQFAKDALGNMSEEDISQYRLTLLGQSFMMFKNWIPRMADVRFGEFRHQQGTDSYEWGRMSMLFNALRHGIIKGAGGALGTLIGRNGSIVDIARAVYEQKRAEVEAIGEAFEMTEAAFIDMYIKGIRTQLKEVLLMASMMGLLLFARSQAPDDDTDTRTKGAYKWLVRTIDKMTDELGFFFNPLSFTAIANGSVFPSVQILNDLVKLMRNTTLESYYLVIGDQEARDKNKVVKYLFKTFPVTKELMMYTAIFNDDLAKEYGISITTNARRNW